MAVAPVTWPGTPLRPSSFYCRCINIFWQVLNRWSRFFTQTGSEWRSGSNPYLQTNTTTIINNSGLSICHGATNKVWKRLSATCEKHQGLTETSDFCSWIWISVFPDFGNIVFFIYSLLFDVYSLSFKSVFHSCREQLKHKDAAAGLDTCGRGGVVRQVSHWCVAEETTYVPVSIRDNMRVTWSNISQQTQ